jgi:hypothetical protein
LPGLGVSLLTVGTVLGIGTAVTEEGSSDRLRVYVLGLVVFPLTSSFTTGQATVNFIKKTTPPEYYVFSDAFSAAMLTTLGIQAIAYTAAIITNQPILLIGALSSTFLGGKAGAKSHIKKMKQFADDWDRGIEYKRVNPGSSLTDESFIDKNDDINPMDTVIVNPYQNLIQNVDYDKEIYNRTIRTGVISSIVSSGLLLLMTDGYRIGKDDTKFVNYNFRPAFIGATVFGTFATTAGLNYSVKRYTPIAPEQRYNANLHSIIATGGTFIGLYGLSEITGSPIPGMVSLVAAPVAGAYAGMLNHKKNLQYSSTNWNLKHSESWLKPSMIPESSIGLELVPDLSDPTIDMDVGSIRKSVVPVVKMTWRF